MSKTTTVYDEIDSSEASTTKVLLQDINESVVPAQRYQAIIRYREFAFATAALHGDLSEEAIRVYNATAKKEHA